MEKLEPPVYEKSDLNVPATMAFGVGLVVFLVILVLVLRPFMHGVISVEKNKEPAPSIFNGQRSLPPAPRLQVNENTDLQAWRARENYQLSSYGWVDKTSGVLHIPISEAMDLVLKEGLPVRAANNASSKRGSR